MKRFPLFPLSRFPALARAAVGGAVALGLVALGVFFFGGQDEAPEDFSASLLTSSDTTSFQASFDLFYLQNDDPTVGSGTWSIPANAANAAATLDIGLVPNTNESDDFIQVDTAEFLLAGVPTWLAYSSIAASSDAFTVDVVEGAESGGARDITIFVSPEEFSGDGSNPDTTISGVGNLLTGAEVISVNFEIASVQGSVVGDQVGSFDIFGTYVARDADFTRYQLDGNGDGQDGGAGAVTIEDSGIVAPVIASAVPHSSTEIRLSFEKAVDATTAQTAANYVVLSCDDAACANPTASATPLSAVFATGNNKTVVLTLDDADALIDADTDFDASSVAPLNVYAVQVNNVKESTGDIAIDASNNVSSSFSYHVPDISLVMSAKDTNGNAVTGNIEVYHTLVATVTADTAGSYELHYESGDNPIARCDSPQEHVFNVAKAGVSVVHEFSFESSGTYSFVACGHSDADRVEGVSTPVEVIIAPETIDIQISLAADDDYDGDYDFDTKDSLVFSVTADFSDPNKNSGLLSLRKGQGSCDIENPGDDIVLISDYLINRFDNTNEETIENTTAVIAIDATDIADPEVDAIPAEYSVVACVESGMASDESAPVGFSIDWALPVVGAPENATLQTTEETQITVTSDIAGSLIVKAFDASFSSTPSCSTGNTLYSSTVDAKSFSVPLIGGLVWDENANDYHANGLAQGEHTLLACVETAESAYEKQSSAEITVTVEPATPPTITVISNGGLGAGSQEVGNGITVKFTSDPGANLNGSDAAAKLIAFDKLNVANSCTDTADYTLAESNDNFSSESSLSFAAGDQLPVGEYIIRLCVTVDEVTSDESWNFEVEAFAAPTVSVEFDGSESNEQNIDTNGSATLNISATGENDLALALWNVTNELAENRTCSALTDESSLVDEDNDFHGTGKFTSVPLSGAEYGLGTHTFLACVTRSHGDYTSISEGATATLTVSEPGTPSVVIAADFIPSGTIYPSTKITVEATATATDFGGGLNDWSNADAELHANITSCPAPGASIITRADDSTSTLIATATSSASGETIEFPAFFAEILGVTEDGESQHNLVVCVTANGATGQDSTEITLKDYETPTVTATITPATIDTTEIATLTITSDIAGTLAVYQTSITFCNDPKLPATSHTNATAATSFSVDLVGEHATNGDLAAGTYTYLACVTSTNGKTGGSMDANDAQSATLTVTDVDAASVQLSLSPSGEVAKNTEITATITSDQVNADGADTMATLHKDACDGEQFGLQTLLSGDALSGYEATISFAATETMNMVACATVNGKEGVSDQATITVKEDEVVVVEGEDIKITTTTSSGETATLTADANQATSGTEITLVDLEDPASGSTVALPENVINAVEVDISGGSITTSLTLEIPTEGKRLEQSMELQKWDETTGEWVTVGEATLSEDGTTYDADITKSGKYALVDLAEARKDIDESGGTVTVEDGDLAGTTVEFPTNAMDGEAQVAVLEPDPSILPDDSLGAVEIVAEQEDFGDKYVTIVIPSAAPGANENPVVTFYDEDDYDKDGITDEWISDGIRNTKFINENIDECKAANGGCAPTPDPLASVGNWFIEFETNHFSIYTGSSEPAPEPGETPVGIRIADGETFRLGYRQTLALRPAGGTGPYTLSVSPADSGSFTDLDGNAITQVAELEDFVFVPDTPVIGNDGRNGIVLTLTDTKGTSDDASDDEQASMTLDLLRRGNMIDLDESFTNGNDGNQVMAGWNESAPFVPTVTGEESGTLSSVGIRLDFSPNKTLRLLRQQTLVFSAGTGDSHAVSLSDSSAGEIVSGNDGTYTFIPSTADNGGKQTTIIITETTDDSQETTAIPVYILARGNTYDKEDSDGLTNGLDANEIMAGWKNE